MLWALCSKGEMAQKRRVCMFGGRFKAFLWVYLFFKCQSHVLPTTGCYNRTVCLKIETLFFHRFSVDNSTGKVTVARAGLDYETRKEYQLTVEATDTGGLRDSVPLTITLQDVNDNAPRFLRREYQAFVKENQAEFDGEIRITVNISVSRHSYNLQCRLRQKCRLRHIWSKHFCADRHSDMYWKRLISDEQL